MALIPGTRIGPYEIAAQIGVGGMGEVYRATDLNLGRDVAIKVLPPAVAEDADRLARFEREARTLASLTHPNIAVVHGLERSGTVRALVMEFVEGSTLEDRIDHGPVPIDQAVAIARQIASALEAAHEQGVVHRDLKPSNVMVRDNGSVKVLDFGLAKTVTGPLDAAASQSPTVTSPAATRAGMILGTAAYMSPEQARGKPVDRRSDVWAFGCVLYEMLTGRRAFAGVTVTETLAAILERDVDWTRLPPTTPSNVRTVLRRTLEKDPKRRLHDIADARIELDDTAPVGATASKSDHSRPGHRWMLVVPAAAITLGLAAWYSTARSPAESTHAGTDRLDLVTDAPLVSEAEGGIAVSPDGRRVAYVAASVGRRQLYLRELDEFTSRVIPGTEGADYPAFSPDGMWIAFQSDFSIRKVAVAGGMPVVVREYAEGPGRGVEQETRTAAVGLSKPRLAPDGRRVAASLGGGSAPSGDLGDIWVFDLDRDSRSRLTFDGVSNFPVWAPDGRRLAYSSARTGPYDIYLRAMDGATSDLPVVTGRAINYVLSWSPDGQWLATVSIDSMTRNDIWLVPIESPAASQSVASTPLREGAPTFSHDGRWIVYASDRSGRSEVYMRPFPGPGEEWTISTGGGTEPVWARKAGRLFYRWGDEMMVVDIATTPTLAVSKPRRLFERAYKRSVGFWPNYDAAPDGQRLLMVKSTARDASTRINVVLNWHEELRRLVPIQ